MAKEFRVFISGVTSEFGGARECVARKLEKRGIKVREQKGFYHRPFSTTTLKLLHDNIKDCHSVICIVGKRSGAQPAAKAGEPFVTLLPDGIRVASYTQWEYFFGQRCLCPPLLFFAGPDHVSEQAPRSKEDFPDLHEAFLHHVVTEQDRYRRYFSNTEELCDQVMGINWEALRTITEWSQEDIFRDFLKERQIFFYGRDWLFNEVEDWGKDSRHEQRLLLVTGMPGAGKSAVVAHLVGSQPCGRIIACHCFLSGQRGSSALGNFVRGLAAMLAQNLPSYCEALMREVVQSARKVLEADPEGGPAKFFSDGIFNILTELPKPEQFGDDPAWIVVDALDEAVDIDDKPTQDIIVNLVQTALELLPSWIRIVITSRSDNVTARLCRLENGRLVRQISIDGEGEGDARGYRDYVRARLHEIGEELPKKSVTLLLKRSEGNYLYLKLALDGIVEAMKRGTFRIEDIDQLPSGLHNFYAFDFRRIYKSAHSPEYRDAARAMLAVLAMARSPISLACLVEATRVKESRLLPQLVRLKTYLTTRDGKYSIFHKSFADWLLAPDGADAFVIGKGECLDLLARFCWKSFTDHCGEGARIADLESNEEAEYLLRYGVDHLIAANSTARAVELVSYIDSRWDETQVKGTSFENIAPRLFVRQALLALDDCPEPQKQKIKPPHLARLLENFYQIDPLEAPITILVRRLRGKEWASVLQRFIDADNYVLRYVTAEVLASVCATGGPVTMKQIEGYLTHRSDVNFRELGAYTLRHLYALKPRRGKPVPIKPEHIKLMANSETYSGRSALGDLLLNLTLQKRKDMPEIDNEEFWNPIWSHLQLDVWDIKAARLFLAGKKPPKGADAGTRIAHKGLKQTDAMRRKLLKLQEVQKKPAIRNLLNNFDTLASDPNEVSRAGKHFEKLQCLRELMALMFSHPLWNVAETAASTLESLVRADPARQDILEKLLFDKAKAYDYWRIRFGAIEAAYTYADVDRMALFGRAVKKYYNHENSRVRALCAENLIAYILDRPSELRKSYLKDYGEAIARWIRDDDCWVLEHIFRLLKTLDRDAHGPDHPRSHDFLRKDMPPLLKGLPRSDWDTLPREQFLKHIEKRRRQMLARERAAGRKSKPKPKPKPKR